MKKYNLQPVLPASADYIMKNFYCEISKNRTFHSIESLIIGYLNSNELEGLTNEDRLSVKLFFEIFLDLVRQGWDLEYTEGTLFAIPPDANVDVRDILEIKKRIRAGLVEARNEQLREPSVKKFILELESPRWVKGRQVSVLNHFLKPIEFYRDLERRLNAPVEIRDRLIRESVKPYVQMATEEKDEFTNIRLMDIWRYSRYSWSLPLSSQPGRQMNYLIRDAAREFHPIIGIGALGSSIVQITSRDNYIGWTLDSLNESDNLGVRLKALEKGLEAALLEVYSKDLVTEDELRYPTADILERLLLKAKEIPSVSRSKGKLNTGAFEEDTKSPVYISKRATELYQLLSSKLTFEKVFKSNASYERAYHLLNSNEEGKRALGVALRSIKKRFIGSSIMDITTCGAIAPYTEILGGKLTSLLMASPQVINDYYSKYKASVSEIASRMKGEPVIRPSHMVLLGTTSLYYTGSSQYNRIKIPVKNGNLQYIPVGKTRGFGSVHFSNRTYKALQELLRNHSELKPESSAFAAGVNYKMRSIGSGLGHLGLRKLQQHENPRLVYLVPLAINWREYLLGLDKEPNYLFDMNESAQQTEKLINDWKDRWFVRRISNKEIMYRLKNLSPLRVSDNMGLEVSNVRCNTEIADIQQLELFGGEDMLTQEKLSWRTLAKLKDQRASFAERLSETELESLHIESKMDAGFLSLLESGKRLYLVGSPGDGKTHIIKKHTSFLDDKEIFYHLDASAINEEMLLKGLKDAIASGRSSVIAINEGPLRRLLDKLPLEERRQIGLQLDKPYLYGIADNNNYDALVINLGARQVLSRTLLEGAIDTVIKRFDYEDAPLVVRYNHSMLQRARVKERVINLLDFLVKNGSHITMHELLGFLSYIITSGIYEPEQTNQIKPYFDAMFSNDNHLHRLLMQFDPASISHPLVDMWLYDDNKANIEWLDIDDAFSSIDTTVYASKKRRYYFEAKQGECLLDMLPDDYRTFYDLLNNSVFAKQLAKRRIIEALSNFFGQGAEENANGLQIWTSLKYESKRDTSVFISSQKINESMVDIFVPKLRDDMESLVEFEPSHIRFVVKAAAGGTLSTGIDIDLELWLSLMKIKRGILNRYQDPIIVRRLTTFMSQLSAQNEDVNKEFVHIQVLDAGSGISHQINVSYGPGQEGKYLW